MAGDTERGTMGPWRAGDCSLLGLASVLALAKKGELSLPGIAVLIFAIHGLAALGEPTGGVELALAVAAGTMGPAGRGDLGGESRLAACDETDEELVLAANGVGEGEKEREGGVAFVGEIGLGLTLGLALLDRESREADTVRSTSGCGVGEVDSTSFSLFSRDGDTARGDAGAGAGDALLARGGTACAGEAKLLRGDMGALC